MNLKMTATKKLALVAIMGAGFTLNAHALLINAPVPQNPSPPYASPLIYTGQETGVPQIFAEILGLSGGSIDLAAMTELYKQNVGEGSDSGTFAANYQTTFSNSSSDPQDADIMHVGGAKITGISPLYLLVKDGNQDPAWYLYDITGWDGMEIMLRGFWPNQGAISHVSLYGTAGTPPPPSVADGGTTLLLLGSALAGLGLMKRKLA